MEVTKKEILYDIEELKRRLDEAGAITRHGENPFRHLSYIKSNTTYLMDKLAKYKTKQKGL
jgi:hypothetical protein